MFSKLITVEPLDFAEPLEADPFEGTEGPTKNLTRLYARVMVQASRASSVKLVKSTGERMHGFGLRAFNVRWNKESVPGTLQHYRWLTNGYDELGASGVSRASRFWSNRQALKVCQKPSASMVRRQSQF